MRRIIVIVVLLATSGCASAPSGMTNDRKPRSEWNNDVRACEDYTRDIVDPTQLELAKARCMVLKGWRTTQ